MFSGTKLYIAIAVGVVLVGGVGYALLSSGGGTEPVSDEEAVMAMFERGEPMKCTFSQTDDEMNVEGVSYVAGERMRGEYVSYQDGQRFESGMYSDGVTMYTWGESPMGVMGMMYRIDDYDDTLYEDEFSNTPWTQDGDEFGFEEGVDFECEPWRVDESVFTVPDGVEFMDMSTMMQGSFDVDRDGIENFPPSAPSMDELPGLDCSICTDLPSGPREACLESLQCS